MLRAAAALTAAALLLAGCSSPPADVARDERGRPVEAGDVRADRIRVGDCFDDAGDDGDVRAFAVRPCAEQHDNEVFHLFALDDGEYPGRDALESLSNQRCSDEPFLDYVGQSVGASLYAVFQIVPSPGSWDDGDRTVVCALYGDGGVPLRGSARRTTA